MNLYGPETERCRELQRQLHDAEQFRALVAEMRLVQRRERRQQFDAYRECRCSGNKNLSADTRRSMEILESAVDRELRLLDSE